MTFWIFTEISFYPELQIDHILVGTMSDKLTL